MNTSRRETMGDGLIADVASIQASFDTVLHFVVHFVMHCFVPSLSEKEKILLRGTNKQYADQPQSCKSCHKPTRSAHLLRKTMHKPVFK